ncbi:MAG: S1 RNA-binding domain-containing protein, partial [Alphaproteobacteria bacterium]|nr:S1 RNA-binding domain-containing protein [Alphaproteobacteria bacterium]
MRACTRPLPDRDVSETSMSKRMLIDSSHPEETRVVVLDGQKVEEFDFEAASKRPLKGNIYLAKVTRVEPSLQAAFVEYGGNRQGFLAFSEIHPDYYQIPVADRMALIAEQESEARRRQEDDIESFEITSGPKETGGEDSEIRDASESGDASDTSAADEVPAPESHDETGDDVPAYADTAPAFAAVDDEVQAEGDEEDEDEADEEDESDEIFTNHPAGREEASDADESHDVETDAEIDDPDS